MTVVDPLDTDLLDERGIAFVFEAVTKKNYKKLLTPLLTKGGGAGFCVNLVGGSVDLMGLLPRASASSYVDTVVEPWLGFYFDTEAEQATIFTAGCAKPPGEKHEKKEQHDGISHLRRRSRAWSRGWSSRRWSTSPPTSASKN